MKNWQWKAVVEKKDHRGRQWRMLGKGQDIQTMWEYFSLDTSETEKLMKDEGIQGQWQRESLAKEYMEQVKSCADTDSSPKQTQTALPK